MQQRIYARRISGTPEADEWIAYLSNLPVVVDCGCCGGKGHHLIAFDPTTRHAIVSGCAACLNTGKAYRVCPN